jgi:hypothetical protein
MLDAVAVKECRISFFLASEKVWIISVCLRVELWNVKPPDVEIVQQ